MDEQLLDTRDFEGILQQALPIPEKPGEDFHLACKAAMAALPALCEQCGDMGVDAEKAAQVFSLEGFPILLGQEAFERFLDNAGLGNDDAAREKLGRAFSYLGPEVVEGLAQAMNSRMAERELEDIGRRWVAAKQIQAMRPAIAMALKGRATWEEIADIFGRRLGVAFDIRRLKSIYRYSKPKDGK